MDSKILGGVSSIWNFPREVFYHHTKFRRNKCDGVEIYTEQTTIHAIFFENIIDCIQGNILGTISL
jgi:hypothetical protein